MFADGQLHQLQVQVVQVADQVERMLQVPFLVLAFLVQEVGDVHVPQQVDVLLLLGDVLAGGDQCREDRLGTELQRPQQVFQLPEVKNVFGDVLPPLGLCYIHVVCVFLCNLSCAFVQDALMCFLCKKAISSTFG